MVAHKYVSQKIHSYVFAHEVVSRKGFGSFRSPKSCNICLECLRLPRVKLLCALREICHSGKRGPGNETLQKRKEQTAFYDRFQPSAGPGNKGQLLFPYGTNILVRLLTINMKSCLAPKRTKCATPFY